MAASINDYAQTYQQALTAYAQQNYEEAATLIDQVVVYLPHDPNTHLLRGHVYYVLQKYDIATQEYQKVLELTSDPEITVFAKNGLESISQYQQEFDYSDGDIDDYDIRESEEVNFSDFVDASEFEKKVPIEDDASPFGDIDKSGFDLSALSLENELSEGKPFTNPLESSQPGGNIYKDSSTNPFDMPTDNTVFSYKGSDINTNDNPFNVNPTDIPSVDNQNSEEQSLELPLFWQDDEIDQANNLIEKNSANPRNENIGASPFEISSGSNQNNTTNKEVLNSPFVDTTGDLNLRISSNDDETLYISDNTEKAYNETINTDDFRFGNLDNFENNAQITTETQSRPTDLSTFSIDLTQEEKVLKDTSSNQSSFDIDDSFDFEAFESAFGSDSIGEQEPLNGDNTKSLLKDKAAKDSNIEFLEDFDAFDDLGNIPGLDITSESTFGGSRSLHSGSFDIPTKAPSAKTASAAKANNVSKPRERDDELFSITSSQEAVPIFTQSDVSRLEPVVSVEQGILAPLENAPLLTKQWFIAGTVGVASALVVAAVSFAGANLSPPNQRAAIRNTGWAMALAAGIASFATTGFMGSLTFKQIRRSTKDLQNQFDSVRQGNLGVQATVYSEDEFGQLAAGFNEMTRVIFTTTNEATRKAQEQEEAKENLQRQVIRLLDDVEGAARGDLTVQAEVTADVLGAVADAFNLTIQNLRDIVQQVKVAAKEVTKGATNSETFARALSTDALRQAEELAVTLNSVQVMTDSIQRVAEAAREAETVARDASSIALKGGEAVENTVAGILEIRETVAETTRKVKRLAESSQEISKIVALISQIASRTNLLALNASIEAARAGEAGRGFAIVADEVRQLADKSAKSLKEIEQIVMQIQSETSSVMTAMEEGTQQVITGTKLAEEAKRSLDNIIQVANRIDILVRSITADTVDQTETSRAVAQVMQSVELTAQETSQEAQRVSGALQHLVGVSRDLIASVERFRVETAESR
ncbi:MAG: HAMP domain-containing protein [Calothrix sp. C42_A2020_038]|nr:HAMP domain-containing protein [Calothrix sp. C42_A2020_038]